MGANAGGAACVLGSSEASPSEGVCVIDPTDTIDSSTSSTRGNVYPVAPWRLRGWGFASVHLADVAAVRHLVAPGLEIVRVLPGKTLSALYFASYKGDSTLVYHEVAVAVAVVMHERRRYAWAPQLYVDEPRSVAGGRAIWGLRKTLASFERTRSYARATVTVRVDGRAVVALAANAYGPPLPVGAPLPTLGMPRDTIVPFAARARARVRLAGATVSLPEDSPYRPAFAHRSLVAMRFDDLALDVPAPEVASPRHGSNVWPSARRRSMPDAPDGSAAKKTTASGWDA